MDDAAFSPNGRSVRCTACDESWFVPAPAPVGDLELKSRRSSPRLRVGIGGEPEPRRDNERREARDQYDFEEGDKHPNSKQFDPQPRDEKGRFIKVKKDQPKFEQAAKRRDQFDDDDYDFDRDEDDVLFEPKSYARSNARHGHQDDTATEKGWRKGKQFIVEDDDDDSDEDDRPFFGRFSKKKKEEPRHRFERREDVEPRSEPRSAKRGDDREHLRFDADDDIDFDDYDDIEDNHAGPGVIVDADWEIVGDEDRARGFGRRQRAGRRRATALARMEDVSPIGSGMFDEEFFDSLQVTPRELEKAVRKARRRAEARDKNRMTPMRAFGWSAWIAAVFGTIYVTVAYRDEIVKFAPGAADAYAIVGIETDPFGLVIENVRHRLAMSTSGPIIEISGDISNGGVASIDSPLLQAEALGPRGELLARWTFEPSSATVSEGEQVAFVTRAPAPDGVSEVALSFAPAANAVRDLLPGAQ